MNTIGIIAELKNNSSVTHAQIAIESTSGDDFNFCNDRNYVYTDHKAAMEQTDDSRRLHT